MTIIQPLILLADDSEVSRATMANILTAGGFRVVQAIDGGSALKVIHEHPVDVAIIDHYMAPQGGFDFARTIRAEGNRLPLIMITSEETSDLLLETTRHGIGTYLRKPVDPDRLLELVRRTLRETSKSEEPAKMEVSFSRRLLPADLMARAIELADRNAQSRQGGPFGAVVADAEGVVVGEGVSGITSRCDPVAHAEVMAIRQATERLNQTHLRGCTLYCSSEPTTIGKALIESVGLDKVCYGLTHEEINRVLPARQRWNVVYERRDSDQARAMIEAFSGLPDKISD